MNENLHFRNSDEPKGKDSFLLGVGLGLITPLISYLLVEYIHLGDKLGLRDSSIYMLGMIVNLLLVRYFFKSEISKTGKGIFLVSFLVVLTVFFFKK
ncbi:hypothetical protein [Solitalea koreensis]|uniref:Stationary phase survival protein SurE n=1 Tax=Solitalea koreensis TaxID=543615 RepID=A0A521AE34_9SPHI|nr:hypothetical protein [Solitalea koreensis]SMO33036.1 hypothetical protein SAMN06265350_10180 [Solitalea koreensis]